MDDEGLLFERALVSAGWELVDLLGRLSVGESWRLLEARWEGERARAAAGLVPLRTGPAVGPEALRSYEGPANQTRFRRTLDFVRPGERVFEIGPGRGYLAGVLLRDGRAGAYRGIDRDDDNLRATRETLQLNGLADGASVARCDLYDLTSAEVEDFGTDLLVCCEVIEHVPQPERAVQTLADALPADAELLISVPLLGRLETIWGHVAIFDAARIRAMVEDSGLVTHSVGVVDNTWVFVLASRDPGPSARAARAAAAAVDPLAGAPPNKDAPWALRTIALEPPAVGASMWNEGLAHQQISYDADGLLCDLTAEHPLPAGGPYGGVRFPVTSPRGLRLELALDAVDDVTTFYVDAYAGDERVARWTWDPSVARPASTPATFVLRPGRRGRYFRSTNLGALESADAVDLFVALKPGSSVRFRVTRAAVFV